MSDSTITAALQELASGTARNKTARLRAIYDQVESAINAGVSHSKIVATLKEKGLEFDLRTFEVTLYRIRRERKNSNGLKRPNQTDQQHLSIANNHIELLSGTKLSAIKQSEVDALPSPSDVKLNPDLSLPDDTYQSFRRK